MSLLQNIGLNPITKSSCRVKKVGVKYCYMRARLKEHKMYDLIIRPIVDADAKFNHVDIAWSNEHKALFIAIGNTFEVKNNGSKQPFPHKISSIAVFNAVSEGLGLKLKGKQAAFIKFDHSLFCDGVYLLIPVHIELT